MDVWINKLKYYYKNGTEGMKLIYIFTISSLIYWGLNFFMFRLLNFSLQNLILLSADEFIPYVWTLFTFPFVQVNIWDLLFIMIMLYFSERIFRIYFDGKSFLKFLFLGNLSGGIIFLLYSYITGTYVFLSGTILGIYSVLFAVISYNPKMQVSLFPFPIQIPIYILGLVFIGLDAFSLINSSSIGVFIARLGAATFGYFYMKFFQEGNDFLGKLVPNLDTIQSFFKYKKRKKRKEEPQYTYSKDQSNEDFNKKKSDRQKQIDIILDKISEHGYETLTKEEKEFLFNFSKKL